MTSWAPEAAAGAAALGRLGLASSTLASFKERRALRAARKAADKELLSSDVVSLRLSWRAAELVTPKERLDLARSLRRLVQDADPRYLPGAQTFNRLAVRAQEDRLLTLADRLADLERPIAPRGVLLTERLLDDVDGPLYDRGRESELSVEIEAAAGALEPR